MTRSPPPPEHLHHHHPQQPAVSTTNTRKLGPYAAIQVQGRSLLVPRAQQQQLLANDTMGNELSMPQQQQSSSSQQQQQQQQQHHDTNGRPLSNLSVLMQQQQQQQEHANNHPTITTSAPLNAPDEADSACDPRRRHHVHLGSSAPLTGGGARHAHTSGGTILAAPAQLSRHASFCAFPGDNRSRRCLSSKELVTLAPPSGSPYAAMLHQKEEIESQTRQRLLELRENKETFIFSHGDPSTDESTSSSTRRSGANNVVAGNSNKREGANQSRNRRRSEHYHAVVNDLCEIVADLFLAESKLIKPVQYGVPHQDSSLRRNQVVEAIQNFVAALPTRYALGADTPSEVLLHMRLMAAARAEKTKAVIHIHSLQDDDYAHRRGLSVERQRALRLVTICCSDADGLLEVITKNLSSGGSRVMDADVMLSSDGIALDRFVVEMTGRLRLDKLSHRIESFLKHSQAEKERSSTSSHSSSMEYGGSIYFNEAKSPNIMTDQDIQEDLLTAVPLVDVLDSSRHRKQYVDMPPSLPNLRKTHSMPPQLETRYAPFDRNNLAPPVVQLPMKREKSAGVPINTSPPEPVEVVREQVVVAQDPKPQTDNSAGCPAGSTRSRRPLVNRSATYDLDGAGYTPKSTDEAPEVDYLTVPSAHGAQTESRRVPLIPFEELMLIETIGTGRVSTIYRAVWQRHLTEGELSSVRMVALKVAMVNGATGDTSHVDELRREADIAARLSHSNICALTGVAADSECFCLAYDYAEGGSLHSLLSDSSRYYEYLPIALDVANGMAYLHSRNIIHRDLKPSNILLTRDHRAKICDFGMSIMNMGQELTAETGTYRYMAPEVIRHENYSSNADVYSFGICLWQLITREVPFANMTPIQAAYAVAEGRRPTIPPTTPRRLQEIIMACWDQDSYRRPSFTYVAMALADYAKMAFSPANVGALTLQIANEMLATVKGNSTVNVDFSTPVSSTPPPDSYLSGLNRSESLNSDVGLEI